MTPRLVLIHGAGFSSEIWHSQVTRYRNAVAPDLPGHNIPGVIDTVAGYADFLHSYLTNAGVHNPIILGHSMGGAIAMQYALRHPDSLQQLVLVATGARLRVSPEILSKIQTSYVEAIELVLDYSLAGNSVPLRNLLRHIMEKVGPQTTYRDYSACNFFDVMNRVEEIELPTLIICGSEDRLTPPKYSEYMKQHITNSHLQLVEGAGHMVMLEKPKEFESILEAYLPMLMPG